MIGLRPTALDLYLERPRLLEALPDSPGYAVWLEAPYGFGKSVLAGQLAARLEALGWRVLSVSLRGEAARPPLARALGLPDQAPWGVVLEALSGRRTLVLLEEVEGGEGLGPLLGARALDALGIVVLASRGPVAEPELPRLRAEGRLVHLGAAELAFTLEEAAGLFGDERRARDAWKRSGGWALPLHLAALTGEVPEREALLEGARESLDASAWEEVLLLAALDHLPREAATDATRRLARAGFAQTLEAGYRLHPLLAETILERFPDEVRRAVAREAGRLPVLERGAAYERAGLFAALGALLEAGDETARLAPDVVLRWDERVGGARGLARQAAVGDALASLGRHREGVGLLLAAARANPDPEAALAAYREAVWWLGGFDPAEARRVAAEAEGALGQVSPVAAARFLNSASRAEFEAGDFEAGEATVRRALDLLEPGHPRRAPLAMNLSILRWNRFGDFEARLTVVAEALAGDTSAFADSAGIAELDLGRLRLLLGEPRAAREHFERAIRHARPRPWIEPAARGYLDLLAGAFERVRGRLARLGRWERLDHENLLRGLAAWRLVDADRPGEALALVAEAGETALESGPNRIVPLLARSLALARQGRRDEALAALPPLADAGREPRLYWQAAHYRITGDAASLKALVELTDLGPRVLRGLVPLAQLPRDRPDLARAYPLEAVLESGWKEAVRLRLAEIPPLSIEVLGGVRVRRLGFPVSLTRRPGEILLLSLLGVPREAIAEALWPDLEPGATRNNLHYTLSALRRAIEPWAEPTYLFEHGLERVHSDLAELEAAITARDAHTVARLYADLAPGVDLPAVNEARDRLRRRALEALHGAALEAPPSQALALLERALEIDPLHEDAVRALLAALLALGRRRAAEEHYRRYADRLRIELGLEPDPDLRRLLG